MNASIYWQGTARISNCLNRLLQEVLGWAPAIILTIFFCKVIIFPLLEELSQKMIPCFQWRTQEFCSGEGSTNSVEDRGQGEQGSGGISPLVRGSAQFANE
jgi:hypothetical protein